MSVAEVFGLLIVTHSIGTAVYYSTVGKESYEKKAYAAGVSPNYAFLWITKFILAIIGAIIFFYVN